MITALVQFTLPAPIDLKEAARLFEGSAEKYLGLPGLIRKYYIRAEDGGTAGGIYLWEDRAAAEKVYSGAWRDMVTERYGAPPTVTYFDTPVVVDNRTSAIEIAD